MAATLGTDLDLPLSANVEDVDIRHMILDLKLCDFESKRIGGVATFYCFPNEKIKGVPARVPRKDCGFASCQADENAEESRSCSSLSECAETRTLHQRVEIPSHADKSGVHVSNKVRDKTAAHEAPLDDECARCEDTLLSHSSAEEMLTSGEMSANIFSSDECCESNVHSTQESETSQTEGHEQVLGDFLVLDCHDLEVVSVEEIRLPKDLRQRLRCCARTERVQMDSVHMQCRTLPGLPLTFTQEEHCLRIQTEDAAAAGGGGGGDAGGGAAGGDVWPRVIRVHYCTRPSGPSLMWTRDQDGKACVFTIGHLLSNRSLFPSQDAPVAMPTWQASVTVPRGVSVLMSGDKNAQPTQTEDDQWQYFYYTSMPMPTCTLALAIGHWEEVDIWPHGSDIDQAKYTCTRHGERCTTNYSSQSVLPCRLWAPRSLLERVEVELKSYLPLCLRTVREVLGPHPFQRLDVLLVPACFDSLGMASPSLLFLSQSLMAGDCSLLSRLAHEVCHSWFGLVIGPADWTEEWLTEGFCTYLEDVIHPQIMQMIREDREELCELRGFLRHKVLALELETSDTDLQTLRPNKGVDAQTENTQGLKVVKNGMNPMKIFLQVHYLKGYFLLKFLEQRIGRETFLAFLQSYVLHFHECLVTSQDFLDYVFEKFPDLRDTGISPSTLCEEWLDCPGMPLNIQKYEVSSQNKLHQQVQEEFQKVKPYLRKSSKKKRLKKDLSDLQIGSKNWSPEQKIIFIDLLLKEKVIQQSLLDAVFSSFNLQAANAEVLHWWCELVVKQRCARYYSQVSEFLTQHQAMGVYLYGEMMLSGCARQRKLARETFRRLQSSMPPAVQSTVSAMLFG